MNYGRFLAWLMVALSLMASLGYAVANDWRRCLYWLFAAGLTATVTVGT